MDGFGRGSGGRRAARKRPVAHGGEGGKRGERAKAGQADGNLYHAGLRTGDDGFAGNAARAGGGTGADAPRHAAPRHEDGAGRRAGQPKRDAAFARPKDGGTRAGDAAHGGLPAPRCADEQRVRRRAGGARRDGYGDGGNSARHGRPCQAGCGDRRGRIGCAKLQTHCLDDPDHGYGHYAARRSRSRIRALRRVRAWATIAKRSTVGRSACP